VGLDLDCYRMLVRSRMSGSSFRRIATIGRQEIMDATRIYRDLAARGFPVDGAPPREGVKGYAEWMFRALGSEEIHSIDISAHEGASHIHDMNQPVPEEWHGSYDIVVDGGALEHVFDFPTAIRNCMNLVTEGGQLYVFAPANNSVGHGFYQFSPELFFRIFSEENGYRIERFLLQVLKPLRRTYAVADPKTAGHRVGVITGSPVRLLIQARRVNAREPLLQPPRQSGYGENSKERLGAASAWARFERWAFWSAISRLPPSLRDSVYTSYYRLRKYNLRNRSFFTRENI
jgi:SAM-dependent methyltransferase